MTPANQRSPAPFTFVRTQYFLFALGFFFTPLSYARHIIRLSFQFPEAVRPRALTSTVRGLRFNPVICRDVVTTILAIGYRPVKGLSYSEPLRVSLPAIRLKFDTNIVTYTSRAIVCYIFIKLFYPHKTAANVDNVTAMSPASRTARNHQPKPNSPSGGSPAPLSRVLHPFAPPYVPRGTMPPALPGCCVCLIAFAPRGMPP